jgi:ribosomal protein S18 acetylase RimI-like enzyme
MSVAAAAARDLGRQELWLGVMTQNTAALAWYGRNGFVTEREEPFVMGGTTVRHLIGHLPVGAFLKPDAARPAADSRRR